MSTAMLPTQELSSSRKEPKSSFLNDIGVELVKRYSPARTKIGFDRYASYQTEMGDWRIGYDSSTLHGKALNFCARATEEEVEKQLLADLVPFAALVEHYVQMPLNAKKKGAVLSYAHSVGIPTFKECNLLQLINKRASKKEIIKEWSPYINRKDYYPEHLRERRRVELNTYLAADLEVPLLCKHTCTLNQCLLNIADTYQGTPKQVKAIEYLEKKISDWDTTGEVMRRFFRLWSEEQGGLGSPKNL